MNYETEFQLAKDFFDSCQSILHKKAFDYASSDDCFSNFESIAFVCKISMEKVFEMFLAVKLARIVELTDSQKEAKNESIEDTLQDMANYACLFSTYLKGKRQ